MFHHTASKQLKVFLNATRQISAADKSGQRIQQIWMPLHYSVWDIVQELVSEERHEPYVNLKDLQNVITDTWHDVDIRQPESEKPYCSGKSVYSSSGKEKWRIYLAHFLLISWLMIRPLWRFGVACIQAATQIMSRLQKLLYSMWRYFVCIMANTKVF